MTVAVLVVSLSLGTAFGAEDDFLRWDAKAARDRALTMRARGQVGKSLDIRITGTDRAYNYKLRATWLTPEVIRGCVRLKQLASAMTDAEAKQMVEEAERAGRIIIQIEIDPREGSGVIPKDWVALLGPAPGKAAVGRNVKGASQPKLQDVAGLAGGVPRDYAYDAFWVVFPDKFEDGRPLFSNSDIEAELTVRIHNKVGKVRWTLPYYVTAH
ncbi:MAG: hypothetical protein HY820_41255 [Acidobacteria bacterium]|nr:hypothetical protein [Acidobacteriota bacterium]